MYSCIQGSEPELKIPVSEPKAEWNPYSIFVEFQTGNGTVICLKIIVGSFRYSNSTKTPKSSTCPTLVYTIPEVLNRCVAIH